MDQNDGFTPPGRTTSFLESQRRTTDEYPSSAPDEDERRASSNGSTHIRMESPVRPRLPKRNTNRGASTKSISEALRMARAREEQETLLGEHEEADDDGCYPPRKNSDPTVPNPHAELPVYTTIHKIRRLVIASIGRHWTLLGGW